MWATNDRLVCLPTTVGRVYTTLPGMLNRYIGAAPCRRRRAKLEKCRLPRAIPPHFVLHLTGFYVSCSYSAACDAVSCHIRVSEYSMALRRRRVRVQHGIEASACPSTVLRRRGRDTLPFRGLRAFSASRRPMVRYRYQGKLD